MRHQDHDEPYIVIEKHSGGVGDFLLGALIGAGVALLFAPRSGARRAPTSAAVRARRRTACATSRGRDRPGRRHVRDGARAHRGADRVGARTPIVTKKEQVTRAMEAGREAAHQARTDLERRLAETKAAYNAGADVARSGAVGAGERAWSTRTPTPEPRGRGAGGPLRAARRLDRRSPLTSLGWTLRDYAKRVWDNAGEDNVLFLAGGHRVQHPARRRPVRPAARLGPRALLHKSAGRGEPSSSSTTSTACCPRTSRGRTRRIHKLIERASSRAHTKLGIWSAIGFVWFSTRLFGSLRTVLASVFDIEQERGIIAGQDLRHQDHVLSTVLITANTLISTYVLIATKASVQVLEDLGIRKDVMGQASAWGTHLVGVALLAMMFFALYKFLPIRRVRTKTAWVAALFTSVMFELAQGGLQRLRRARSIPARCTRARWRRSSSSCSGSTTPR